MLFKYNFVVESEKMNALNLFPIIWKDTFQFDWQVIEPKVTQLFSEVDSFASLEVGGKTTVGLNLYPDKRPHTWEEFSPFMEWARPRVEYIWQKWGLIPQKKYVTGSWFNLHNQGDYTKEHHHHSTHIVISSYLQCPPNSGGIEFKNPFEIYKYSEPVSEPDNGIWTEETVKTNDVLFFPGWLKHRTAISSSEQRRIVFTMNISGQYE